MPNKAYQKGYRFEIRVIMSLEKLGWSVIRSGKSRFPDSFAAKDGWCFYMECKNHKTYPVNRLFALSKDERDKAFGIIGNTGFPFFLIYNENRRIKILPIGGRGLVLAGRLESEMNARRAKVQDASE